MESVLTTPAGWVLLPWTDDDVAALRGALAPEDAERQLGGVLVGDAAAAQWIDARQRDWADDFGYSWAAHSPGGELAGSVTVSAIDRQHDTGWVSYWTSESFRGRGVATEATTRMAAWALAGLCLFRLELGHRMNNPASCAVATAAGFRVEGRQRAKLRYGDRRFDVELHARLAIDLPAGGPATDAPR